MEIFKKLLNWARVKRKHEIVPRITARVLIEQGDKYLFLVQTNERGGRLSLPGGGIKAKESIRKGLIREVKEETNLIILKKDLIPLHTHYRKKGQELEIIFFFKVIVNDFSDLRLGEPAKFSQFLWYSKDLIPENTTPGCMMALKKINKGLIFSERKKKKSKTKLLAQEVDDVSFVEAYP